MEHHPTRQNLCEQLEQLGLASEGTISVMWWDNQLEPSTVLTRGPVTVMVAHDIQETRLVGNTDGEKGRDEWYVEFREGTPDTVLLATVKAALQDA